MKIQIVATILATIIASYELKAATVEVNALSLVGTIRYEWWAGIAGKNVVDLTADVNYPDNPTGTDLLRSFEGAINWSNNYGIRVRGYINPSSSGSYTFWIATDDQGELWLSSDEDPLGAVLVAHVPGWSKSREWDKYPEQQSAPISLQAGQRYYVELLQKENTGGDHFAVAWQGPGINQEVIPGGVMSPYVKPEEVKAVIIGIIPSLTNEDDSLIDDLASYSLYTGASSNEVTNFAINFPSAGPIPTDDEVIAPAIFIDKDTWVAATAIDQAGNESVLSPAILCCDSTMRAPTTFLLLEVQVLHTTK